MQNNDELDITLEETDENGDVDLKDKIKKLKDKIKKLEEEKKEYLAGWQRAQADYINREKEIVKEKAEISKYAIRNFIIDLLPVLDTYDAARLNKEVWEKVDNSWRSGIEYIFQILESKLKEEGLISYAKEGDIYDPILHEAIENIDTEDESKNNVIASVIMRGYKYDDVVIRPAKVKVYSRK